MLLCVDFVKHRVPITRASTSSVTLECLTGVHTKQAKVYSLQKPPIIYPKTKILQSVWQNWKINKMIIIYTFFFVVKTLSAIYQCWLWLGTSWKSIDILFVKCSRHLDHSACGAMNPSKWNTARLCAIFYKMCKWVCGFVHVHTFLYTL